MFSICLVRTLSTSDLLGQNAKSCAFHLDGKVTFTGGENLMGETGSLNMVLEGTIGGLVWFNMLV